MDNSEDKNSLKVITYTGKTHLFDYIPIMTLGELKLAILSVDSTVPDFDFLYAGRMLRSADKVLGDFINEHNMTLYTNAKGVHGGCSGGGCA